jgi:nitrogen-specific signal transduction histidine kinase
MKKKQTAVEWLIVELNSELNYIPITQWDRIRDLIQRAKAMEKEQIIDFAYSSIREVESELGDLIYKKVPEEIYNETYGGNNLAEPR